MTQDGSEGKGKILKKKRRAALHVLSFRNPDGFCHGGFGGKINRL